MGMSRGTFEFSDKVDADMRWMARQLGIDLTDVASMTNAVLKKSLNLLKYIVDERKNSAKIFIASSEERNESKLSFRPSDDATKV